MTLILRDLRVPLDLEGGDLAELAAKRLGMPVPAARIVRKSLDARAGREPVFIYTLELELPKAAAKLALRGRRKGQLSRPGDGPGRLPKPPFDRPLMAARPVVVGSGPAGLFAAWQLVQNGFSPLLIERGPEVNQRGQDWKAFLKGGPFKAESNLLFGEGGAGAFSDGKLTTRIKDPRVETVLAVLVNYGAPEHCLWEAKPHVGSNALPAIVRNLRRALVKAGAEVRFDTRVDDLIVEGDQVTGVRCGDERIEAGAVVLAVGHSARDTVEMLFAHDVAIQAKPLQMGLRIEHPQELINRLQYGAAASHPNLPVAEYSLVSRKPAGSAGDVFSFCMCPGGEILPATQRAGLLCVNGASPKARDGQFANSGLVVTVDPSAFDHDPRKGLALQARLEARAFELGGGDFGAPGQRAADFLENRVSESLGPTSYPFAVRPAMLAEVLPNGSLPALQAALRDFDRRMPGYAGADAMLVGPESRSSAPLRMERDNTTLESTSHPGLYPAGEGAGWAGGIMSAAVDGLRTAEAIAFAFKAPRVD